MKKIVLFLSLVSIITSCSLKEKPDSIMDFFKEYKELNLYQHVLLFSDNSFKETISIDGKIIEAEGLWSGGFKESEDILVLDEITQEGILKRMYKIINGKLVLENHELK